MFEHSIEYFLPMGSTDGKKKKIKFLDAKIFLKFQMNQCISPVTSPDIILPSGSVRKPIPPAIEFHKINFLILTLPKKILERIRGFY